MANWPQLDPEHSDPKPPKPQLFHLKPRDARPVRFFGEFVESFSDGVYESRVYMTTDDLTFVVEIVQIDEFGGDDETTVVVVINQARPERAFRALGMSPVAQEVYRIVGLDPAVHVQ